MLYTGSPRHASDSELGVQTPVEGEVETKLEAKKEKRLFPGEAQDSGRRTE